MVCLIAAMVHYSSELCRLGKNCRHIAVADVATWHIRPYHGLPGARLKIVFQADGGYNLLGHMVGHRALLVLLFGPQALSHPFGTCLHVYVHTEPVGSDQRLPCKVTVDHVPYQYIRVKRPV